MVRSNDRGDLMASDKDLEASGKISHMLFSNKKRNHLTDDDLNNELKAAELCNNTTRYQSMCTHQLKGRKVISIEAANGSGAEIVHFRSRMVRSDDRGDLMASDEDLEDALIPKCNTPKRSNSTLKVVPTQDSTTKGLLQALHFDAELSNPIYPKISHDRTTVHAVASTNRILTQGKEAKKTVKRASPGLETKLKKPNQMSNIPKKIRSLFLVDSDKPSVFGTASLKPSALSDKISIKSSIVRGGRKRRRVRSVNGIPSFVQTITVANLDYEEEQERLRRIQKKREGPINVNIDALLGLVLPPDKSPMYDSTIRDTIFVGPNSVTAVSYSSPVHSDSRAEGSGGHKWFEGVVPLFLPDDTDYISELHCLIRSNLELFTATAVDTAEQKHGRRIKVVKGMVGVRCVHCASAMISVAESPTLVVDERHHTQTDPGSKLITEDQSSSYTQVYLSHDKGDTTVPFPSKNFVAGSVSYPTNVAGLYPLCSQKPAQHFSRCPYLPDTIRAHFRRLTEDEHGNQIKKRPSKILGSSAIEYYAISARRIGLVDTPEGMRLGRNPLLKPLSFGESISMAPQPLNYSKTTATSPRPKTGALHAVLNPPTLVSHSSLSTDAQHVASLSRIKADEASEEILSKAIAADGYDNDILLRTEEKYLATDFIFLCVRQMSVCHATSADIKRRGKRAGKLRLGLAGVCCRHCSNRRSKDIYAARYTPNMGVYFVTAPDNLASIVGTIYTHLQKCCFVPPDIKSALVVYKKLHSNQMAQLKYGSQRRYVALLL